MFTTLLQVSAASSSSSSTAGGVGISIFFMVIILIGLALFGIWLWSLIHCICNRRLTDTNRLIGILLIILLGHLGSFIYLFLPRESYDQR